MFLMSLRESDAILRMDCSPEVDFLLGPATDCSDYIPHPEDKIFILPFSRQKFESGSLLLGAVRNGKETNERFFIPILDGKTRIVRGVLWQLELMTLPERTIDTETKLKKAEQIRNILIESLFGIQDVEVGSLNPF